MPRPARPLSLIVVAALATVAPARLLTAQTTPDSAAATPPAAVLPAAGHAVRITFADPAVVQLRNPLFVRPQAPVEGRLVGIDRAAVTVDLPHTGQLTVPAAAVRRIDVRRGRGACSRSPVERAGCTLLGAAVGAFAITGAALLTPAEDGALPAAAAAGAVGGAVVSFRFGRQGWERVPGWPAR